MTLGICACRVWDMREQKIVRTMETGKEVTSIEIINEGEHITTADGNEVTAPVAASYVLAGVLSMAFLGPACPGASSHSVEGSSYSWAPLRPLHACN